MTNLLLVGLGGALGSMARYLFGAWVQALSRSQSFPFGTLTVNLIGCLVIGFLSQWAEARSVFTIETRALVFVGVLGGFTTFSSFSLETMLMIERGQIGLALGYALFSLVGAVAALALGLTVMRSVAA